MSQWPIKSCQPMPGGHHDCISNTVGPVWLRFSVGTTMNKPLVWALVGLLSGPSVCTATSIIFPAFGAPLVTDDAIFAHHTYGEQLICLDRTSGTVRWRIKARAPIRSISRIDSNRIVAVFTDKLSVIGTSQGKILETEDIGGTFFGRAADGNILSMTKRNVVVCSGADTGTRIWEHQCLETSSNVTPTVADDLIFLAFSPRNITTHSDSKSEWVRVKGTNMITCLSAKTGTSLWTEPVPLNRKGFGVHLQVSAGRKWLLCKTDNDLRLLDGKSGAVASRWHSMEDIDGAGFYHDGQIAVCFGGIGARTRTIRIFDAPDFTLAAEFTVDAVEVASARVVGNVMLLSSLYRNIGVDLRTQKVLWQKGQRHCTEQDGFLYFGEHADNKRVLGVCDPKTGHDTTIYTERIEK